MQNNDTSYSDTQKSQKLFGVNLNKLTQDSMKTNKMEESINSRNSNNH